MRELGDRFSDIQDDLAVKVRALRGEIDEIYKEVFDDDSISEIMITKYQKNWQVYLPSFITYNNKLQSKDLAHITIQKGSVFDEKRLMRLSIHFIEEMPPYSSISITYYKNYSKLESQISERPGFQVTRNDHQKDFVRESIRMGLVKEIMSLSLMERRASKLGAND